ncbi:unnamed protein product [Peniophora sp. CBMAI 1063]|nr:unnamed protein product [Peniophora sp. CBMAI 1063]
MPHMHFPSCIADQLRARVCHTITLWPAPSRTGVVSPSAFGGNAISLLACKPSHSQILISSSVALFFPFGGRAFMGPGCNPLFCNLSTRNISGNIRAAASPDSGSKGGGRLDFSLGGGNGGRGDNGVDMQRPMGNKAGMGEMVVFVVHAQDYQQRYLGSRTRTRSTGLRGPVPISVLLLFSRAFLSSQGCARFG